MDEETDFSSDIVINTAVVFQMDMSNVGLSNSEGKNLATSATVPLLLQCRVCYSARKTVAEQR